MFFLTCTAAALATASHFGEQEAASPDLASSCEVCEFCMEGGRGLTEADQLSLDLSTAASSCDSRLTGRAEMGPSSNCAESRARISLSAALDSLRKAAVPMVVVAKSMPHCPMEALLTPAKCPDSTLADALNTMRNEAFAGKNDPITC